MKRLWRAWVCLFALALPSCSARAQEPPPEAAEPEVLPPIPQRAGMAVLTLGFDLGIIAANHGDTRALGPGFGLEVVTRRRSWPVMVGLGGGVLSFDEHDLRGPTLGYTGASGGLVIGPTTQVRTSELRHAELLLRYEPLSGRFMPFLEGALGIATLWNQSEIVGASNEALGTHERQRAVGLLYGGTLGMDVKLLSLGRSSDGDFDLALTMGTKLLCATPMKQPHYGTTPTGGPRVDETRTALVMWVPFLALSLTIDTRAQR